MHVILIFKAIYATMAIVFSTLFVKDIKKHGFKNEPASPTISAFIGGISYFLDTLGIGSYAVSTPLLRGFKQIQDKNLPGTLNVAAVLPIVFEAFIFISIIKVDPVTVAFLVAGTCIGAWVSASFVHKMPEKMICLVISIALFIAAGVLILKQLDLIQANYAGTIGLTGFKLCIATVCSVVIGALGSMGIGSYAPFLALSLTLGLSARATFPIMMSAAALACGFASIKFIKIGNYERKSALYMAIFGIIGVLIAAYIVKTLPLYTLTWVAIGVIYYSSVTLFLNSYKKKAAIQN